MDNVIFLTSDLHEIGYADIEIDFEVGSSLIDNPATNDFEFEAYNVPDDAAAIYIDGTEFGGIIEYKKQTTEDDSITYQGFTWRGLLSQWVICPDDGEDYKIVSGDLNAVIKDVLADVLGGFFNVPDTDYGISVTNYQFNRYCTVLEGLEKLVQDNDAKLYIHADKTASGEPIEITVEAADVDTISGSFDEDTELTLLYTNDEMGINHLICLGSGELAERQRIDLYIDGDGNVSGTQYYTGFDERQEVYDFSNAESEDDLESYGKTRLKKLQDTKTMEIKIPDDSGEYEVGDIASGIFPDGTTISSPITKKVLKITAKTTKITYEVEGD